MAATAAAVLRSSLIPIGVTTHRRSRAWFHCSNWFRPQQWHFQTRKNHECVLKDKAGRHSERRVRKGTNSMYATEECTAPIRLPKLFVSYATLLPSYYPPSNPDCNTSSMPPDTSHPEAAILPAPPIIPLQRKWTRTSKRSHRDNTACADCTMIILSKT